jgi:hypothetical protein
MMMLTAPAMYRPQAATGWRLGEPPADPLSEAELSLLWEGQRFPAAALATPDGDAVEVVFPGRRGGASGPDFRDAVVRLRGEERRGDVELHVRASAWRGHGHHRDPAYDGVVLHVVYLADEGPTTQLCSGSRVPVAALAPWLARRTADLAGWLAGPAWWREPCQDALLTLGVAGVREVVEGEGRRRFATKVARLREECARLGVETALWRAMLDAVAYGGDREAFERLAAAFPPALARELTRGNAAAAAPGLLEAALLAVAGLGEAPPELDRRLPPPIRLAPQGGSRPAGRPERRIAAFALLYAKAAGDFEGYTKQTVKAAASPGELVAAWQVPGLGRDRATEILVNVILPLAATDLTTAGAAAIASRLSLAAPYGKTAFLERNLRGADGRRLVKSALAQQGLLALLGDWCSQGGCGRCPLS